MEKNGSEFDVVILGSGPAGLQAAVHASRARGAVAVVGRLKESSLRKAHVENYCCMSGVMTGEEMLAQGRKQAENFGARFIEEDVVDMAPGDDERISVTLESGSVLTTWSVILAMGVSRNRLGVPGEKALSAKGVSYCVECDGNFYKGRPVAVVGNGSAAASGALTLLMIAEEVHLIYKELEVDETLRHHVENSGVVRHPGRWVRSIEGEYGVESVTLDDESEIEVEAVFIEMGAKGALELATKLGVGLDMEDMRFITVNRKQETNIPGVYAAGDICGPPWQMAKAIGEGCVAGLEAAGYAKKKRRSRSD